MLNLIDKIPDKNQEIVQELRLLIKNFDIEKIIDILN
jgi:hypothetical protein